MHNGFIPVRNFELNSIVDDTDLAFILWNDRPGSTPTASIDSDGVGANAAANTAKLIDFSGTNVLDLTNVGLGFDFFSGLQDFVNALAKDSAGRGWFVKPHAIRRDDKVFSTNTKILVKTATAANGVTGLEFYWDTSRVTFRRGCVGLGHFRTFPNGESFPALARTMKSEFRKSFNVPTGKSVATATGHPLTHGYAARLRVLSAKGTFGSGATTLRLSRCTEDLDGEVFAYPGQATTVEATINATIWGDEGYQSSSEERIVFDYFNSLVTMTASELRALGEIGDVA